MLFDAGWSNISFSLSFRHVLIYALRNELEAIPTVIQTISSFILRHLDVVGSNIPLSLLLFEQHACTKWAYLHSWFYSKHQCFSSFLSINFIIWNTLNTCWKLSTSPKIVTHSSAAQKRCVEYMLDCTSVEQFSVKWSNKRLKLCINQSFMNKFISIPRR